MRHWKRKVPLPPEPEKANFAQRFLPFTRCLASWVLGGGAGNHSAENHAVTVVSAFSVTVQAPVPGQSTPDHPAKRELADGVALRVTTVPREYLRKHAPPQSRPPSIDMTAPNPEPAFAIPSAG